MVGLRVRVRVRVRATNNLSKFIFGEVSLRNLIVKRLGLRVKG
jgi:hypothetical protein